jgi:hypothetical protein
MMFAVLENAMRVKVIRTVLESNFHLKRVLPPILKQWTGNNQIAQVMSDFRAYAVIVARLYIIETHPSFHNLAIAKRL